MPDLLLAGAGFVAGAVAAALRVVVRVGHGFTGPRGAREAGVAAAGLAAGAVHTEAQRTLLICPAVAALDEQALSCGVAGGVADTLGQVVAVGHRNTDAAGAGQARGCAGSIAAGAVGAEAGSALFGVDAGLPLFPFAFAGAVAGGVARALRIVVGARHGRAGAGGAGAAGVSALRVAAAVVSAEAGAALLGEAARLSVGQQLLSLGRRVFATTAAEQEHAGQNAAQCHETVDRLPHPIFPWWWSGEVEGGARDPNDRRAGPSATTRRPASPGRGRRASLRTR